VKDLMLRVRKLEDARSPPVEKWRQESEELENLLKTHEAAKQAGTVFGPPFNSQEEYDAYIRGLGEKVWDPVRRGYYYTRGSR